MNRLAGAVSPYLLQHAADPVEWRPWGDDVFVEAARRDVPVFVSIGYSTCHWCHVMARESFRDPGTAAALNAGFVSVKVDREEHPDVDAACMAAAGAFTDALGWPLNVFLTPAGRMFHAGTYSPPVPLPGRTSFRQVLAAVEEAWLDRRDTVEAQAASLAAAIAAAARTAPPSARIDPDALAAVVAELSSYEDHTFGGFGGAPKFPVAPVLGTLAAIGRSSVVDSATARAGAGLADRTLRAVRALRDPVEGGFFRYAVRRDWSEPHYERMLTDNAVLLADYTAIGDREAAGGIASFLTTVLARPGGGFGSAQDSESVIDGRSDEGGYFARDAAGRALLAPPAVDGKVLTGWNGLAMAALAAAGVRFGEPAWVRAAETAADRLLETHRRHDGTLVRATRDGVASTAAATLEDYGGLADGLLEVALATGRADLAVAARGLVDLCGDAASAVPGGGDPTVAALGIGVDGDPNEGASPGGESLVGSAAWRLHLLTGDGSYRAIAEAVVERHAAAALARPIAYGGLLGLALAVLEPVRQVVVVTPDAASSELVEAARGLPASVTAVVTEQQAAAFADAGFALFDGRRTTGGRATAYVCEDFLCRLPETEAAALIA